MHTLQAPPSSYVLQKQHDGSVQEPLSLQNRFAVGELTVSQKLWCPSTVKCNQINVSSISRACGSMR